MPFATGFISQLTLLFIPIVNGIKMV